ncbi:MAG: sugar kinase [Proteobacteria bacterium]|nr:sugar kinase [Pseudomonadota bacterium]
MSCARGPSSQQPAPRRRPSILCTGIAVLDEVFLIDELPRVDTKRNAIDFKTVSGGCAANAAVAIGRLGAAAAFAGPLGGPQGEDSIGDRIIAALTREQVDCHGCIRVAGLRSPISTIIIDARGARTIVTYRDEKLLQIAGDDAAGLVASADAVLADNRMPNFSLPICKAAQARGIPLILDADKPMAVNDPHFAAATHTIFSAEALRGTMETDDLVQALGNFRNTSRSFLAVTDGANGVLWFDGARIVHFPAYRVDAVDTLAAGDVFHGAFAVAVSGGAAPGDAVRFAAAAAAIKCSRFGGITAAPERAEVDRLLAAG